jgi:hypothetical protein
LAGSEKLSGLDVPTLACITAKTNPGKTLRSQHWGRTNGVVTVRFLSDWSQQQDGDIQTGAPLRIDYDPQRLPHCRSYRYGQPSWSIAAYLRFSSRRSGAIRTRGARLTAMGSYRTE